MKKVLLVEDNDFLAEIYLTILKNNDLDVTLAKDGEEAYNEASKGGWDLVLMDVTIPKLSGFEVAKKLKDTPPSPANKSVVFLTSLDSDKDMEEAEKLGDGFIKKTDVTPGDLLDKLSPFLNK